MASPRKKVLVIGATGRVGSIITRYALDRGHSVSVLARKPEKVKDVLKEVSENLHVIQGDALNLDSLRGAVQGHDIIISVLGPADLTKPHGIYTRAYQNLVASMDKEQKLIALGGYGILPTKEVSRKEDETMLYKVEGAIPRWLHPLCDDMAGAADVIRNSGHANFVIPCPPHIPEGIFRWLPPFGMTAVYQRTGKYRLSKDAVLEDQFLARFSMAFRVISQEDLADFFVRCIDEDEFVGRRVGIAY